MRCSKPSNTDDDDADDDDDDDACETATGEEECRVGSASTADLPMVVMGGATNADECRPAANNIAHARRRAFPRDVMIKRDLADLAPPWYVEERLYRRREKERKIMNDN